MGRGVPRPETPSSPPQPASQLVETLDGKLEGESKPRIQSCPLRRAEAVGAPMRIPCEHRQRDVCCRPWAYSRHPFCQEEKQDYLQKCSDYMVGMLVVRGLNRMAFTSHPNRRRRRIGAEKPYPNRQRIVSLGHFPNETILCKQLATTQTLAKSSQADPLNPGTLALRHKFLYPGKDAGRHPPYGKL